MTSQTGAIRQAVERLHQIESSRTHPEPFVVDLAGAPLLAYLEAVLARLTEHRRHTALLSRVEWDHAMAVAKAVMEEQPVQEARARYLLRAADRLRAMRRVHGEQFRVQLPGSAIQDFLMDVHQRQEDPARAAGPTRFECQHAAAIGAALG